MSSQDFELREQDRWLPIANVARLMKNTLPATAKVSKDAKECMQECVSEFISFITSEASDKCLMEKRKTINGEDILYSMTNLGFENYSEVLKIYLAKYREQQALKQERGEIKRKKVSKKNGSMGEMVDQDDDVEEDGDNSVKKDEDDYLEYPVDDSESKEQQKSQFEENEYMQQLYEQDYGDHSHYPHNPQYHNTHEDDHDIGVSPLKNARSAEIGSSAVSKHSDHAKLEGTEKVIATTDDATLSLNLNDNVPEAVSESEELASLANGHHGENVLYRYQGGF
ncbi:hypothetical protein KL918_001871 [Ogataea parapolymorpha]|uniref:Subunit of the heme-activated, glucose-repressed Hap2p/3p/4p/5p CCAAT-binding complex n=1 Tax=Ogataea parapolymorpha (strain ATCC 26012 / BCRC 20466 / JCM 22074 / NRRL Y-7560 / DL-1) TaxID=871575 RepID=W1QFP5_OGAPD|nr:Subunit of the heme-activated, glucose-repressed Hap2p/3p/4p/5p CCAAT-binding complex [Ogataea parapolymorpha DL-1]ESW98738.1 Subunit of the heme-activated, glucose-repressed Hap2p/3p/4p/5p CCAAT-binding complex [Ogataea parapolymorpha DL-1]KAG7868213.1 hypothetical protein KL918_001871 [Ogataea parapolymorpha]KAG7874167.1 hypothetical protein KL916_001507 [Ogataea parapolymorpha]